MVSGRRLSDTLHVDTPEWGRVMVDAISSDHAATRELFTGVAVQLRAISEKTDENAGELGCVKVAVAVLQTELTEHRTSEDKVLLEMKEAISAVRTEVKPLSTDRETVKTVAKGIGITAAVAAIIKVILDLWKSGGHR